MKSCITVANRDFENTVRQIGLYVAQLAFPTPEAIRN